MITVSNVSLSFGGQLLFKDVNLKFTNGNCYGIIGANGAGKSTFLKILCGEIEPTTGEVVISKEDRLSVLRQDHFAFDEYTVLETVIMGNKRLYEIMKEKDELYAKEDFTEEDGDRAGQLESEFAELNGWEAESDASKLIQGLGLSEDILYSQMSTLSGNEKVKELLAQAAGFEAKFDQAMDDDFNTADAIAAIFELVKFANTCGDAEHTKAFWEVLKEKITTLSDVCGLIVEKKEELLDADVEALIEERQAARKAKNFARADEIRQQLLDMGIVLEDTREGVKWKRA